MFSGETVVYSKKINYDNRGTKKLIAASLTPIHISSVKTFIVGFIIHNSGSDYYGAALNIDLSGKYSHLIIWMYHRHY